MLSAMATVINATADNGIIKDEHAYIMLLDIIKASYSQLQH